MPGKADRAAVQRIIPLLETARTISELRDPDSRPERLKGGDYQ